MPQMFPMPIMVLMLLVSVLSLLSMVRVFWQRIEGLDNSSFNNTNTATGSFLFKQTW